MWRPWLCAVLSGSFPGVCRCRKAKGFIICIITALFWVRFGGFLNGGFRLRLIHWPGTWPGLGCGESFTRYCQFMLLVIHQSFDFAFLALILGDGSFGTSSFTSFGTGTLLQLAAGLCSATSKAVTFILRHDPTQAFLIASIWIPHL